MGGGSRGPGPIVGYTGLVSGGIEEVSCMRSCLGLHRAVSSPDQTQIPGRLLVAEGVAGCKQASRIMARTGL